MSPAKPATAGHVLKPLPEIGKPQAIVVDPAAFTPVTRFEIYVLVTMRLRMALSQQKQVLENVLLAFGLALADAQRIHDDVRDALADESSFPANLRSLLNAAGGATDTLTFSSEIWPTFDFIVTTDDHGAVKSARYYLARAHAAPVFGGTSLPVWSVDIETFAARFGPLTFGQRWPIFDEYLPAYEEHEFERNGERYSACFSWGLFMHSSRFWT